MATDKALLLARHNGGQQGFGLGGELAQPGDALQQDGDQFFALALA
ncbi:MAG: hypothetical protein IJG25_00620 [Thermoguttaceae bacterium]|nr:hypothetical protein [Thermoguttaceae bacterium]